MESHDTQFPQNGQNIQSSPPNTESFSPRKVAMAIGVSESSLKRWCDAGHLLASKTAGGHRRLSRGEVVSFIKRRKLELADPEMIGLPRLSEVAIHSPVDGVAQFYEALLANDETACEAILTYLYLNGREMAEIFDLYVAPAFEKIGDGWSHGKVEVYEERRACQTCLNSLAKIKSLLPPSNESAMTAMGGSIENDQYALPTFCVEMTLTSLGWNAISMGSNLPFNTLLHAAIRHKPAVLWISISYLADTSRVADSINEFAMQLPGKTTLIVGGNAIDASLRSQLKNVICCDNLSQMVASVRNLKLAPGIASSIG